jgi:cobaltochelatase CobT
VTTIHAARQQERVEQLCAAAVRALTGWADLDFRGGVLHRGTARVHAAAPHLRPEPGSDDFGSFRGAADGLALRLLHSDPSAHARARPDDRVGALVFELLEQFRVESLVDTVQTGTVANLRHRFEAWTAEFHASGLTETASGLLLYAVAQIGRTRVTGDPLSQTTEDLIEATRFGLAPLIGGDLAKLGSLRHDQQAFAVPARRIAQAVAQLVLDETETGTAPPDRARRDVRFSLAIDESDDPASEDTGSSSPGSHSVRSPGADYRVFTRAWDRELPMTRLTRAEQLRGHRERLDDLVEEAGLNISLLARRLRSLLMVQRADGWDTAQEEGLVDSSRLSRLVTSPTDTHVFRSPHHEPAAAVQVTFLLDCSGSMRRHQERTATLVDSLVRALDLADIDSEVLGFTTGAWNGGRAERDWRRTGRPPRPGRLNERLHVVLKEADQSWRRARPEIAGLLRPDFYREALDGEAVDWACSRLAARDDLERRLLVVVSDGSPMDSATHLVNDPGYLDRHLDATLARVESDGVVEVVGLGVGVDLSRHYRYGHVLDFDGPVDQQMLGEVVDLLAAPSHRRRPW